MVTLMTDWSPVLPRWVIPTRIPLTMSHSSPLIETEVFFALNLFPVKSVPKVSWRTMPMG